MTHKSRAVDPEPDPYWIRIQLEAWIRIRNLNTDPDPDPGGQKCRVVDPYSFFTDPDPVDPDGGQYGSGSNPDPGL